MRTHTQKPTALPFLARNQQVAAKIEKSEPVIAPGVPWKYPAAQKLVTEDCIRPLEDGR